MEIFCPQCKSISKTTDHSLCDAWKSCWKWPSSHWSDHYEEKNINIEMTQELNKIKKKNNEIRQKFNMTLKYTPDMNQIPITMMTIEIGKVKKNNQKWTIALKWNRRSKTHKLPYKRQKTPLSTSMSVFSCVHGRTVSDGSATLARLGRIKSLISWFYR